MLSHDSTQEDQFALEPEADLHANQIEHEGARQKLALQMLRHMRDSLGHVIRLLEEGDTTRATRHMVDFVSHKHVDANDAESLLNTRTLEGVFDGQSMIGSDGMRYAVPENYASKSRLVEGDILKLTIPADGSYLYKQIGPVERKRLVGRLTMDSETQTHIVVCADDMYKVLAASVAYFKGSIGDETVIVVPSGGKCVWAAVENITASSS